jgi:phage host-nuclease inhibitor protein Gam
MSKGKRVKPEINMMKMENLDAVNAAMGKIRGFRAEIRTIESETQERINSIKERAAKRVKRLLENIEPLENGILAYAEYNRDELFRSKKTIDLIFGRLGFRKSSKISIKQTTLGLLKKFGFKKAVIVKETVNKDVLKLYTDQQLKKVDATRIVEDSFWYEVKEEDISEQVKNEKK